MTKSNSGIAIMDKKILQKAVILSAFFLTGCSCFQDWGADQTYVDTAYETETVTVETKIRPSSRHRLLRLSYRLLLRNCLPTTTIL